MNHDIVYDSKNNEDYDDIDDSYKQHIIYFIICITMIIIITLLIINSIKVNIEDVIMQNYRTKNNEKTIIRSSNYLKTFHNSEIQHNLYK